MAQISLPLNYRSVTPQSDSRLKNLDAELRSFDEFGKATVVDESEIADGFSVPIYLNEFWTAKQRAAHSLHEISYRACFKPQLPRFFIERLTHQGDAVYDPFMGRGTTLLEAALMGRNPIGCDINPLSERLVLPRLNPPIYEAVEERLQSLNLSQPTPHPEAFEVFYHPNTLTALCNLRDHMIQREKEGNLDAIDQWIRMTATNRLTGHSPGFFSVYTLPPNQAVSLKSQRRINEKRNQIPPERDVIGILLKKTRSLLKDLGKQPLPTGTKRPTIITGSAESTESIASHSIDLVITSPPFLNVVNYKTDNWLRCWFNHIDPDSVDLWMTGSQSEWQTQMTRIFIELRRVLKPGGFVVFEVGEVLKGKLPMEKLAGPAGRNAGLVPECMMINAQAFTKTANCWGVDNAVKGTNTNRLILFRKHD